MKHLQKKLIHEIIATTAKIKKEFPELYLLLNESPLFLSDKSGELNNIDFENYLDTLKTQLASFEKAHSYHQMCE